MKMLNLNKPFNQNRFCGSLCSTGSSSVVWITCEVFQREVADFFFFPLSLGVCALIVLSVATLMTHRGSLFSVFPAAARSDKFSLIFLTTFITAATSAAVPVLWVLSPPRPLSLPSMPSIIRHPPPDDFFTLSPTSRPRRLDVVSEHLNSQEPRITLNSSDVGATLDSDVKGPLNVAIVFLAGRGSIWFIWLTNQWWEQSIWPIWLVDIFSYLLNCFVTVTAVLVSCPQRDHTAPWWYLMVCLCGDSLDPLGSSPSPSCRWGLVRGTVGGVIPPLASDCWDWLHPRSWKKRAINEPIAIFSSVRIRFLLVCLFCRCDFLTKM